VDVLCVHGIVS